jgi:hypothetical protein
MTWEQVLRRRAARHGLVTPVPPERLADVVVDICGAHAQVMSAAEVSLGLRVAGITRADVRAALWEKRTLVKTFGPRGTVHLLAASDLGTWNAVLGEAHVPPGLPPDVRFEPEQTDAVLDAIDGALGEAELTADELGVEVEKRAGAWAGARVMPAFQGHWPRWMQALRTAAFRGVLCFGPNRGAKVTYASPRRWLGAEPRSAEPDPARTVLRRFLSAYGPARPEHFARWLAATPAWANQTFARAGADLEKVDVEGDELWRLAGDGDAAEHDDASGPGRTIRLLPYFDAYVVGAHPRGRVFPGRAGDRALTRSQAGNVPVLLANGLVIGVWHQRRSGSKLALTVEPLRRLTSRDRRELDDEVELVGRIQEATASLTIGPVDAGPHA